MDAPPDLLRELRIALSDGQRGRDPVPSLKRVHDVLKALYDARETRADSVFLVSIGERLTPTIDALVEGRWSDAERHLTELTRQRRG